MLETALVPPNLIDFIWPSVEGLILSAVNKAHGEITTETVKEKLKADLALLVILLDKTEVKGLGVFQIDIFDSGKKVLLLTLAAGELSFFTGDYDEFMLTIAKNLGCEEIRAMGARLGWEKALKKAGTKWEPLNTILIYKAEI